MSDKQKLTLKEFSEKTGVPMQSLQKWAQKSADAQRGQTSNALYLGLQATRLGEGSVDPRRTVWQVPASALEWKQYSTSGRPSAKHILFHGKASLDMYNLTELGANMCENAVRISEISELNHYLSMDFAYILLVVPSDELWLAALDAVDACDADTIVIAYTVNDLPEDNRVRVIC